MQNNVQINGKHGVFPLSWIELRHRTTTIKKKCNRINNEQRTDHVIKLVN